MSSRVKQVAILLPTAENCDNDNDSDKGSSNNNNNNNDKCSWIVDGTSRLMHVANEYYLPTLGHNQQSLHHHHHHHSSSSSTISLNEGKGMEDEIITTDSIIDKNERNDKKMFDGDKDDNWSHSSSSSIRTFVTNGSITFNHKLIRIGTGWTISIAAETTTTTTTATNE